MVRNTRRLPLLLAGALACSAESEGEAGAGERADCLNSDRGDFARPFEVDEGQYPFRSCAFETDVGDLHYVDEGPRDAEHTVVMVHGNPTWSFLYRNIARAMLDDGHRVILMDHIGSGMSDVPPTSEFDYRPRSHADHLEALVVALDLTNVTLVVQDWGGPIGLGMGTRQSDRIGRILILNTWAWSVDFTNPGVHHAMVDWNALVKMGASASPTFFCDLPFAGQAELNALEADPDMGPVYESVLAAYLSPAIDPPTGNYRTDEPCAPMQIFAESISDDNAYQGEVEARLDRLRGKPYSLLFGLSDQLFGALRCDTDAATACPTGSSCSCDAGLLPAQVTGGCEDPQAAAYHVCKTSDGSIIDPYADRFEALLGDEDLVRRDVVPEADHMVQEWAPERVIEALRELIAHPS